MSTVLEADPPLALEAAPTVIDVEASGFGRGSYPIEVGFVLPDGHCQCMLIKPTDGWLHWDPAAERLHHISRDLLARHGHPVHEVVERLNTQLAGRTVYTDGWGNDYSWLSMLYELVDRQPSYHLDSLQKLLTEDQLARWDGTRDAVAHEDPAAAARHRASADAKILQATVMRLRAT